MKKLIYFLITVFFVVFANSLFAQKKAITISGVVVDADTVSVIPYVNIRLKNTYFGTASNNSGHFSFTASEGDTLLFTFVGYFDAYFIMPQNLTGNSYSLIQLMRRETILLEEIVIFPWPGYNQLKNAFLEAKPEKNMGDRTLESKRKVKRISREEYHRNRHYYNVYHNNQLYDMTGIIPPNNFLNPIQWSNFIRKVREKQFSQKK